MISREEIYKLVEVFYQPTFKTFFVNSMDGLNFIKPVGVFVSLGITTSRKVLNDIKDTILGTGKYNAVLVEISSKKVGNRYLNTITNTNPDQYYFVEENVLSREEALKKLNELKDLSSKSNSELLKLRLKISKLQELIDRLDNISDWESHSIQEVEDDFRIYHKYINYKKEGDVEYRVGIYVSEN